MLIVVSHKTAAGAHCIIDESIMHKSYEELGLYPLCNTLDLTVAPMMADDRLFTKRDGLLLNEMSLYILYTISLKLELNTPLNIFSHSLAVKVHYFKFMCKNL